MPGVHDLGGKAGFGPVNPAKDEPVFHHDWERRAFAITLAAGFLGHWNLDMSRYARETMEAQRYLASSYYEHWMHGLELLLVERGLLTRGEVDARLRQPAPVPAVPSALAPPLHADAVWPTLRRGANAQMDDGVDLGRFAVDERVVVRTVSQSGHIRLPEYLQGRRGIIAADRGAFIFPDLHATGIKAPQRLYNVRFESAQLWPTDGLKSAGAVYADLFESYLRPDAAK